MTLEQAVALIDQVMTRMDAGFRIPLFDEWSVYQVTPGIDRILHYSGARSETLRSQFARDIHPLADELRAGQYEPGHFYFSHEGAGALYDSFMCIGKGVYAVFNNTDKSMAEITADPLWKGVQHHFVDLGETFRTDPLTP
ncbi:MAG: hypothetical protein HN742_12885 [Lentisphaerae bacterium]|nr:hypothetical protein [Lentisphaerota bacterium]MBT4821478.1 hypothetical protein [Lentisphaerota bacterium]MBT5608899.1 hypothetical protein [Lentisphaerota bacterium]MBT7057389.1 hypothetical protein [Lentisphaerota bacterium]MBT7842765.1 hypothetical protein [Lentisphaerota bacterium]